MDDLIREMLEPDRPAPGVVARRRRLTATTAIIGLAAIGVTSLTTNALFTNQDSSSQEGYVTGTIAISGGDSSFSIDADVGAAPGDFHYTAFEVQNTGTLALRYAIESDTTGDAPLTAALEVQLFSVANAGQCVSVTEDGHPNSQNSALNAITGVRKLDTESAFQPLLGSSAQGQQNGTTAPDAVGSDRILASGVTEVLCLGLHLPFGAESDGLQGTTATIQLQFDAEQVAHND